MQGSPARTSDMRSFFTKLSMEMEGDFTSSESAEEEQPSGASPSSEHAPHEESHPEVSVQRPGDGNRDVSRTNVCDHEHFFDDDLQAAIDFFKLPPPLLSPVPSPPPMTSPHLSSSLAPVSWLTEFNSMWICLYYVQGISKVLVYLGKTVHFSQFYYEVTSENKRLCQDPLHQHMWCDFLYCVLWLHFICLYAFYVGR